MGQRDVDRLEKSADRNLTKFSKGKCKVRLGRNTPMQQEKLWHKGVESAWQHSSTLACHRHRARLSQQCLPAMQNTSSLLGTALSVSSPGKAITALIQTMSECQLQLCASQDERHGHTALRSAKGHEGEEGLGDLSCEQRL